MIWQFKNGSIAELNTVRACLDAAETEPYKAWDRQLCAWIFYERG